MSAFKQLRWGDVVMVEARTLRPGDVLTSGHVVLGRIHTASPREKLVVLGDGGRIEHHSYGQSFRLYRMVRPEE